MPLIRLLLTVTLAACVAACATPPERPALGPAGTALAPRAGGLLADTEAALQQRIGTGQSGFRLLESNEEALRWRLALVDSAQHSLDLQYYIWWGDESGNLLLKRVIAAAERGVRVRLVLDDLSTLLEDEAHVKVRDASVALVDAHPNIEIRLFNAWHSRGLAGRAVELVSRMDRINHRMHNKLLVADNRAAIIGGRNVGNEYFGLSHEFNFRDLDVLGIGPVARQASAVFDRFWNSEWVMAVGALGVDVVPGEFAKARASIRRQLEASPVLARFPLDVQDWEESFARLEGELHPGASRVHTDTPDADVLVHHMPEAIRALVGSAAREVLIANAYIIPGEHAVARIRQQTERGVRVRMLTNSLASHDVPAVNSHYKQWRRPLLEAGVELYEMRSDAALQGQVVDTPPVRGAFVGLHVKAMVIDRERVFIGSMNLDPRSWGINSEMGVVIESAGLAGQLANSLEANLRQENAWRVSLDGDGRIQWSAGGQTLTSQPARNFWQRVQDVFFMAFPRDLY